jgi:hypothetical protein
MGIGVGVIAAVILVSLVVSKVHGRFSMGQALYFIFVGLLVASVDPSLAVTCHNFVMNLTSDAQSVNLNK